MSSDDDFDAVAYKELEDVLYEEQSGSDDDLDSEVEEVLYSQVHYASSLVVSENSIPGKETPGTREIFDSVSGAQRQKGHLDSSVIEISSDDDNDDDDNGDDYTDNHEDLSPGCSFSYPEVVNIFSDENISAAIERTSKESSDAQNEVKPGEIVENWDLDERDLQDSKKTKQRPRYYTPGKGLPNVKCYNCNEKGHLSQNCPQPKKISVCFLCGGVGHVKRFCPNELCFNCHEPGHISKQCNKPRRQPFHRCNRCHVLGHIAKDCPDRWRQYHLTTEVGPLIRPDRPVTSPSPVYCYNCGKQGHYGHECQEENATIRSELPLPFVVYYDGWGQMSSCRERKNHEKQTSKRKSKDKQRHQAMSQGFYDQPRQQADCDMHGRLFQPPPEKVRKTDDSDVRRVSFHNDNYETSEFNSPYADPTPQRDNNRNKTKKKPGRHEECQEENATIRSELPLPFVVYDDGWSQMSSSRERNNHKKQTSRRKSKDKQRHQAMSQGFYDQPRQQADCDMDWRLFQPPPEKVRKTDDSDVRRVSFHDDNYETSEFNSPYGDRTPNNRNKGKKKPERYERFVEILDPSPSQDGLIEEPYVSKKKKTKKRGKQHWQGRDRPDNNFHDVNLNARNSSKQHSERRFSNPQRKAEYRSFEDGQFDSKRTSSHPMKGNNKFTSDRGFHFNSESRRKKWNPRYFKRYTF